MLGHFNSILNYLHELWCCFLWIFIRAALKKVMNYVWPLEEEKFYMSSCEGKLTSWKPDRGKLTWRVHLPCDWWCDLHFNINMRINRILFTCSSSNWSPFLLIHSQSLLHSPRGDQPDVFYLRNPWFQAWVSSMCIDVQHTKLLNNSWWRFNPFWPGGTLKIPTFWDLDFWPGGAATLNRSSIVFIH